MNGWTDARVFTRALDDDDQLLNLSQFCTTIVSVYFVTFLCTPLLSYIKLFY